MTDLKTNRTSRITHHGPVFEVEVIEWTDHAGHRIRRDVVRHPGAVTIIPMLSDDEVVVIRNRRIAVDDVLIEFPAGRLEPGEDPGAAAARELREETGYTATEVIKLGQFLTSPGLTDEKMHVFVARGLGHVGQALEPGEDITCEVVSTATLAEMAGDGRLRDGKTLAGLALLQARKLMEAPRA